MYNKNDSSTDVQISISYYLQISTRKMFIEGIRCLNVYLHDNVHVNPEAEFASVITVFTYN